MCTLRSMEGAVATNKLIAIMASLFVIAAIAPIKANASVHRFSDCGISIDDLMSCKFAVVTTAVKPPVLQGSRCCTALKAADLTCLCSFINYMPSFIDPDRAMQLPVKCGIADSFHC